jgi:hypothetical protein
MHDLLEYNIGDGYCHAWYARRFLQSVRVTEEQLPHSGLGLSNYVHWSSPIRRFGDLQVHACVKRFLRRKRVYELIREGQKIPDGVTACDLGLPEHSLSQEGTILVDSIYDYTLDQDVDYREGGGMFGAARTLQRQSQQYWMFEYVERQRVTQPDKIYESVILGCIDPERGQHAIYLYELGLEHRYTSPGGRLDPGVKLQLRVDNVSPRNGILSFVRAY